MARRSNRRSEKSHVLVHHVEHTENGLQVATRVEKKQFAKVTVQRLREAGLRPFLGHSVHAGRDHS